MNNPQKTESLSDELNKLFLSEFDEVIEGDPDWKENPVDLDTYIGSPLYQDLPPLTVRQRKAAIAILGEDSKKIFRRTTGITTGVFLWGKGAGKDYLSSIIISYLAYVLCCLKSPQKYLGIAPGEPIDIVNVAYSATQANLVFFAKLKQRLQKPMFARFSPHIIEDKIEFPNEVRLHSRHSENESYEGFNILAWIMDEASAFKDKTKRANADNIFSTLKSSATSRFGQQWIGIIISFPRYQNDFTIRQYELSKTQPHIYGDMGATWEIHPVRKKEDFADDYRTDPEDARTKYECIPPAITDAFITLTDKIYEANRGSDPILFVEHTTTTRNSDGGPKQYTALAIEPLKKDFSHEYFLHGDPGLMSDSFVLAMGHVIQGEEKEVKKDEEIIIMPKVQIDLILVWKPQDGKPVDILNVKDAIIMLSTCFNLKSVTFDKWNSATTIQELIVNGIKAEDMSFSRGQQLEMYRNLRALIYNNLIYWPTNQDLCEELSKLQLINGVKVDHPVDGSKDIADAVAGCAWNCSKVENDAWIMSL
jgi:hypothetical protein